MNWYHINSSKLVKNDRNCNCLRVQPAYHNLSLANKHPNIKIELRSFLGMRVGGNCNELTSRLREWQYFVSHHAFGIYKRRYKFLVKQ